ncbi:esterase-like activity of phytase family protein [Pseudooceanicola sp. HF7]|uniref:esterase-like activity of phytase family protein n=1 Tax=Pseudooceanicola sp. HF7 TaxID=2721560 RepID=UPI001431D218|nr:esterase-like activity of phytase family protein [Pseudooceanicola sp. HF7]NIZ10972.1 esterase-like activity of phytase family protein [Pseudooceanicola sp. HF7]
MRKRSFLRLTALAALVLVAGALYIFGYDLGIVSPSGRLSNLKLSALKPEENGFSAIEMTPDGLGFAALGDRGTFFSGRLFRLDNGVLIGWTIDYAGRLRNSNGRFPPVSGPDAEGLTMGYRDGFAISSEKNRDIMYFSDPQASAENLPAPPDSKDLPPNQKYESLALDVTGRLYTMPEHSRFLDRDFPLWRLDPGADYWVEDRRISLEAGYRPVGADFGPDGFFYLLERSLRVGVGNRVRRFDLSDPLETGQVVWVKRGLRRSNFEGLSVWERQGCIVLTMISDNNFSALMESRILEIVPGSTSGDPTVCG